MRGKFKKTAKKLSKAHKRQAAWQRVVRSLAMIVVFCTTYALILPAITLQSDTVCGLDAHSHSETCWAESGELLCTKQDHTHTDDCYPVEEAETLGLEYRCGYALHAHSDACRDAEGNLICSVPEHAHAADCVVDRVDLTADVESSADWDAMIDQLDLGDRWQDNLLTIADSQLGYGESDANCVLVADALMGYTRYGDWYGNPYGAWDDMFLAFCLRYAGVPGDVIPGGSDTQQWLDQLAQKNMLYSPDEHLPETGDLVFCKDSGGSLFAALVKGQEPNSHADGLQLRLIAGDTNDQVAERTAELSDVTAVLPVAEVQQSYETGEPMPQPSETTESQTATEPEESSEALVQTAETENYIVTVTCPAGLVLPEGAELRVTEYARDSEVFRQRCAEAGYELEWLLNIGFYIGEEELTLNSRFEVVVTSKQGDSLGQDITHFADSGTERINGSAEDDNVSFSARGFSDFGGGVARAAGSYTFTTVDPSQLQENTDYVIYCGSNNNVTFLSPNYTDRFAAIVVNNSGQGNNPYQTGSSWSLSAAQLGNADENALIWRVVRQNGQTYLVRKSDGQRMEVNNGWLNISGSGNGLNIQKQGAGAYVGRTYQGQTYQLRYDDQWRGTWYDDGGTRRTDPTVVYFAALGTESSGNYPHAVHTGEVDINQVRFFNLCENGDAGVSALEGCVFEITGDNGYRATVISGSSPEVNLPADIPDGSYTITEVSVPTGYIRDTNHTRTFEVQGGMLVSDRNIGTFINHNIEQLTTGKTAEVEDYNNRIYQVLLNAESHLRMYQMDPIDVLFVVDQSNSMLFPAGLQDTGKTVTLNLNDWSNGDRLEALGLDKNQMHYIISDPKGTSTVWAVWHDGTSWMYQDASYYAKAKHNNDPGYQDDNETVIFPTAGRSYNTQKSSEGEGVRSNGGDIRYDLSGSGLGNYLSSNGNSLNFKIYTATSEYNRLHYLEESLANMIYELAAVNAENRVTLTRFTKQVTEDDCFGPVKLTPENTEELIAEVRSIKTSGGTRQDIALKHIWEEHLNDEGDHYSDLDHTYTFLITDGAPVRSSGSVPDQLGNPTDGATTTGNTIYGQIKGYAQLVRSKSQLMTVGLGMDDVEGGKAVLKEIATSDSFYCALDDARDLIEFMQNLVFESFRPKEKIDTVADIVDEISDSFYPIAWVEKGSGEATGRQVLVSDDTRDWILLEAGDRITLEGAFSADGSGPGLLQRKADGTFYITWEDQVITEGWSGDLYLKAKEDFIGGNAIDTNKSASVTAYGVKQDLETPTVNVRLLDMNQMHSEVTLYLGDTVNGEGSTPLDSLRYFYENTQFTKLVSGLGDVLNRYDSADGLEAAAFYLRYAMGRDLTEAEWTELASGNAITVEYTYDDGSSHGAVGYFTFQLEKTGLGSQYGSHEAISACQPGGHPLTENCEAPAEAYTLHVTYTAYRLGEHGRPAANVHNDTAGPGREVGTGSTIPTGMGVVAKHNIHEVHVISGQIVISKRFDKDVTDESHRTFTFTLHRLEDGTDTSRDVTKTITIQAGASAGMSSITFDNLKRGTYTVTEAEDPDYAVRYITVTNQTNCYSVPPVSGSGTTLLCIMGNNTANENVIGKAAETDRYTSYIDPVHGVLCVAEFTNAPIIYAAELPVEKIWSDPLSEHTEDAVYVVLYESGVPVITEDGSHRLLRLDAASDWKGVFVIPLADESDTLDNYDYTVREVSQTTTDDLGWQKAILESDGSVIYYEEALEEMRLISVNGKGYLVQYGTDETGAQVITNLRTADLPTTGGMGTHMYTFSGLLTILAALMYGCSLRRKRGRRAAH